MGASSWPQHLRDESSWITGTCLRAGSSSCPNRGWVITSVMEILALQHQYLMFCKSQSIWNSEVISAPLFLFLAGIPPIRSRDLHSRSVPLHCSPTCGFLPCRFPACRCTSRRSVQLESEPWAARSLAALVLPPVEKGNVSALQPLRSGSAPIGITPSFCLHKVCSPSVCKQLLGNC